MITTKGFIALVPVIILSSIILVVISFTLFATLNATDFYNRITNKQTVVRSVRSCARLVLLKLQFDDSYTGDENIEVQNMKCSVLSFFSSTSYETSISFENTQASDEVEVNDTRDKIMYEKIF